ncbi:hypothetical protein [Kitasatospora sp. NPDC001175]|uniref:hypothetical protein n=1 Tax=Kitasatospora sp. NPDC001175 TaxID=3157103 RepID=UPI003CFF1AE9
MALSLDERRQRRQALREPVRPRHLRLRRGSRPRGRQLDVLGDAERREQVPLLLVELGPAGSLRPDPSAELLALERGLRRQLRSVDAAVGLQPPLPRDGVGELAPL